MRAARFKTVMETVMPPVSKFAPRLAAVAVAASTLIGVTHAAAAETKPAPVVPVISPDGSMYRAFGGHEGLVSLMDDFVVLLVKDPRTHDYFVAAKQAHLKAELVDQFCVIMGGGCTYSGKDMKTAHAELGVTEAAFNALVEDLQITMDKHHIPFAMQNKLLAALAPQHRDIVTAP